MDTTQKMLYKAGIQGAYTRPEATLASQGVQGERIKKMVSNGVISDRIGFGDSMIIVGSDKNSLAVLHLLSRAVLLGGENLRLISLPELRDIVCFQKQEQSMETIMSVKVLSVEGFYDSQFLKAFSESEIYTIGWWLIRQINNGVSMILQSSHPIASCEMWSKMLRDILAEKTKWHGITL